MTLIELQDMKDRLDMGVIMHKNRWLEVLDWAIALTANHEGQDKEPKDE